jgi:subtilase family serine protease
MALDTQWAHAMAPNAKIYLVEAPSTNFTDLMAAVNIAKSLPGVRQVSMSFGGTESPCLDVAFDNTFQHNHVTFFASAGDVAGSRDYPALCKNVIAVGGTNLNVSAGGVWQGETVWTGTGCGSSSSEPRPIFQDGLYPTIGLYRAGCDIAAVGDPSTGVSVYDSLVYQGASGWLTFGGTSVSCPLVAGIVNSSGVVINSTQLLAAKLYLGIGDSHFHDITSGSSSTFSAGTGWDFPSGVGSPNGLGVYLGGQ